MRRSILAAALLLALLSCGRAYARESPYVIHVDVEQKRLTLWQGSTLVASYPVATGSWETPSPIGVFRITHRFSGQMGGFGTCFLGLNVPWGNYGIHGTNKPESIGSNASHGCFRMRVQDSEELYGLVGNGAKVVITAGPYGLLDTSLRPLQPGDRSSHVKAVQARLLQLGFTYRWPDGIYGADTQKAVAKARSTLGLAQADKVDAALYRALGIIAFE